MATSTALVSHDPGLPARTARTRGLVLAADIDRARAFRRARAHSMVVRLLRLILPLAIVGLCGYYAISLRLAMGIGGLTLPTPPSFSTENLAMENPRYEGFNKDGGKFVFTARTAKQDLRDRNAPVQLTGVDGRLLQPDQTVTNLKAKLGTFDNKQNQLELYDGIEVVSQNGLKATLSRATILTKEHKIISREPVLVEMPSGNVRARQMVLDQQTRQVAFSDGVTTRLTPEQKPATAGVPAAASPAQQRGFGTAEAPVDITSRTLNVDDLGKLAVFRGAVRAVQGQSWLESEQLDISYEGAPVAGAPAAPTTTPAAGPAAGSKVKLIVSRTPVVLTQGSDRVTGDSAEFNTIADTARIAGHVVMTSATDRSARSDQADIDQKADTVLLTGNVHVVQGKNELKGRRLLVERKAGRAQLTSPAEPGLAAGRIFTRLYQSEGKQSAAGGGKRSPGAAQPADTPGGIGLATFKTDPNAPIDIEAASLNVDDAAKIALYKGDVRTVQGDFKMATAELTAFYIGQMALDMAPGQASNAGPKQQVQLNKIEARKGVVVTSRDGQTATGDWADFDTKANTVVLGGEVKLTQGQTVVRGNRLLIDMTTGESRIVMDPAGSSQDPSKRPVAVNAVDPTKRGGAGMPATPPVGGAGNATATAPDNPGPFSLETSTGRPRMVLYPNQLKGFAKKDGETKPAVGAQVAQPAPPAAPADATPRKRRGNDEGGSSPTSIFRPPGATD